MSMTSAFAAASATAPIPLVPEADSAATVFVAAGAWDWKTAYEACEVATVLFLRKYGKTLIRKAGSTAGSLPMLAKIAGLLPTHTRRSEEAQTFLQFSTLILLVLNELAEMRTSLLSFLLPASRSKREIPRPSSKSRTLRLTLDTFKPSAQAVPEKLICLAAAST